MICPQDKPTAAPGPSPDQFPAPGISPSSPAPASPVLPSLIEGGRVGVDTSFRGAAGILLPPATMASSGSPSREENEQAGPSSARAIESEVSRHGFPPDAAAAYPGRWRARSSMMFPGGYFHAARPAGPAISRQDGRAQAPGIPHDAAGRCASALRGDPGDGRDAGSGRRGPRPPPGRLDPGPVLQAQGCGGAPEAGARLLPRRGLGPGQPRHDRRALPAARERVGLRGGLRRLSTLARGEVPGGTRRLPCGGPDRGGGGRIARDRPRAGGSRG